jgi:adenylate cyclase
MQCPNCAFDCQPGFAFCPACGTRLPPAPAEPLAEAPSERRDTSAAGERRMVTVMFAEVGGLDALARAHDQEEVTRVLNLCFEALAAVVRAHDGNIDKFLGDGLMVSFGAPIAHEDDPQRALTCALAMRERLRALAADQAGEPPATGAVPDRRVSEGGAELSLHFGVNTGEVFAGTVGVDHKEYTVIGDVVNVAAHLKTLAGPGQILVGEGTYRLTRAQFAFEDLPSARLKRRQERAAVYQLIGRRAAPADQTERGDGLHAPLIGREIELSLLQGRLEAAIDGSGGLAFIIGEAGLGKSRLTLELRKWAAGRGWLDPQNGTGAGGMLRWLEGRSLSYGNQPFGPLLQMLRALFSLVDGLPDEDALAAIDRALVALFAPAVPARDELLPYLGHLLGLALPPELGESIRYLDPEALSERRQAAFVRVLQQASRVRPIVLQFEDLHWADAATLALFPRLCALTVEAPLLIIALLRPMRQSPAWAVAEETFQSEPPGHRVRSTLGPLGALDGATLADALALSALPPALKADVLAKAEGNPLFVEEILRSLVDRGVLAWDGQSWRATDAVATVTLPDSLHAVLTARIDQLPPPARITLQEAAVLGRIFTRELLGVLDDRGAPLDEHLQALTAAELLRVRGPGEYIFKHVLTQEAAYAGLLHSRRRDLHARIGEFYERRFAGRLDEALDLLAHHYGHSGDLPRGVRYNLEAGRRAARGYANEDALAYFRRAQVLAEQAADFAGVADACQARGNVQREIGDYGSAVAAFQDALQMARRAGDIGRQVGALGSLTFVSYLRGLPEDTMACARETQALAESSGDPALIGRAQRMLGVAYEFNCQYAAAAGCYQRALALAEEQGDLAIQGPMLNNLGEINRTRGKYADAIRLYARARELAALLDDRRAQATYDANLGAAYCLAGEWDAAQTHLERAIVTCDAIGFRDTSEPYAFLALVQLGRGQLPAAWSTAQRGLQIAREIRRPEMEGVSYRVLARIAAAARAAGAPPADAEAPERYFERSLAALQPVKAVEYAHSVRAYGDYLTAQGAEARGAALREQAADIFRRLGLL